jgi:hypothetical protein
MGRTARFDQVFVTSLDADPVEQDVLTDVKSIITKEIDVEVITAEKFAISNTNPTKQISIGSSIFVDNTETNIVLDVTKGVRTERLYVNDKLGIAAPNATNEFQIGPNAEFVINRASEHLVTARGNVAATNVLVSNIINVDDTLIIDRMGSNVLKVVGNTHTTNISVDNYLSVGTTENFDPGSNVAVFNGANVVIDNGILRINGNLHVNGNAFITESAQYETVINLVVENSVIQQASTNNKNAPFDNALLMTEGNDGTVSNLVIGYQFSNNEFAVGRTQMAPDDTVIHLDPAQTVNLHVYGQLFTDGNVAVANTNRFHTLSVGSNVYFDDAGSNLFVSTGNVSVEGNVVAGGVRIGNLLDLNPEATIPVLINQNIKSNAITTTGYTHSGIANTAPTNTLSVGAKIFGNLTSANTLTVIGNTTTTNLFTESIYSHANVSIHADRFGGDSATDALVLKSGPTASNVSSIEISGASTSNTNQIIKMSTKNTERIRITPEGRIGISNTHPSERMTVAGNVHTIGGDGFIYGNTWGTAGQTSSRMYSSHLVGENKIENIVAEGKGLNIYASKTATMGTPKLTILETSNVGIGTATPKGRLHTSGGTVFINNEITNNGTYKHLGTPLIVSNATAVSADLTDFTRVLELCREGGTASSDGVRATFKMGKHTAVSSGTANSQLDIFLASTNYETEVDVLTLRSDGLVGIGTTTPTAHLEVHCTGAANPTTNGLLVHNFDGDSGDAILAAKTRILAGNVFTSYIQTNAGSNPRGWSTGVTGTDSDFRITQNTDNNKDSSTVGLYISGDTGRVGLGTDAPRGALDVAGNVVVGNELSFSGLTGDEYGNTLIIERTYNSTFNRSELILYKGNEGSSFDGGPDRIRHLAAEHIFQTYTGQPTSFYAEALPDAGLDEAGNVPLCIIGKNGGTVVIGGQRSTADSISDNTKLVVNGDIEFGSGGAFRLTGFAFSTTEAIVGATSNNIIRSLLDGSTRRPVRFVHEIDDNNNFEFARFDETGNLGIGTAIVDANVHIYSGVTDSIDVFKLESPGVNKETGMLIYTGEGEGGYLRGFSNSDNGTTGLIVGVANNSTFTNCIHMIHSSNVGIGTNAPDTKLHVYDGMVRVESPSSNATIELTTSAGSANIYADTTGNVYINPLRTGTKNTTFLNSNVEVIGDFSVDGALDLGNQVGLGLDGATANTTLHVNGGIITNSDQVATKRYSNTFPINDTDGQDVILTFKTGTFYAKIIAVLRDSGTKANTSTMVLEATGGTHDGSTGTIYDIAIGPQAIMGSSGGTQYPWSSATQTGKRSIRLLPATLDGGRNYIYDITVEVTSACDGGLKKISHNLTSQDQENLDNETAGVTTLATFTY